MVNYDGTLHSDSTYYLNHNNRGLRYGDALFETLRVVAGRINFWEDHYLRLMASMRILRMEIPMNFTMEYLESEISRTLKSGGLDEAPARVRLTVFRKDGGLYMPTTQGVSYIIDIQPLDSPFFILNKETYEIELFKDFYLNADMLSTLKSNNRNLQVVGSIYAQENGYANCLLLNHSKNVVEALNGNLFLVKDNCLKTPPLQDGCLNGIIRKKILEIAHKQNDLKLEEVSISPFELQKADELFITNSIVGIQPVSKYRKAQFKSDVAADLLRKLSALARLS